MVEGRQALSEVRRWDMEDIERFNDFLQMKADYEAAHSEFINRRFEKENQK